MRKREYPEYKDKVDNWYLYKGAKPPERIPHGVSEDDIDQLLIENLQSQNHQCSWTQSGNRLKCDQGQYEHGKVIPVGKMLNGQKGNTPILRDVVISA